LRNEYKKEDIKVSYKIEKRLLDMLPYEPLKGSYNVRVDANESYFKIPEEVIEQFKVALDEINFNRYPDPFAVELCDKFAKYFNVDRNNVVAGNGSDELINLIVEAFLKDGDTVLTLSPDFSMYRFYSDLRRAKNVVLKTDIGVTPKVDDIIDTISKVKPNLVILSNPCNPTGAVIEKSEIIRLVNSVNCLMVIDEAYMDFSDQTIIEEVDKLSNTIVLRTLSKAFAAASLRIGFAVSNVEITDILKKVKAPYNVNSVSQKFGCILLDNAKKYQEIIKEILTLRDKQFNILKGITSLLGSEFKAYKSNANFIYIKTEKAVEIYKALLDMGIAIRCFKSDNAIRISVGNEAENKAVIDALFRLKNVESD